jgi:putative SOS response-associated peptidase YedK
MCGRYASRESAFDLALRFHIHGPLPNIAPADGGILAMAGIWEGWRAPNSAAVRSFDVVTTSANAEMAAIHDRMPVILAQADWDTWLHAPPDWAVSLLRAAPPATLRLWPISIRVNKPSENAPDLLSPVA